MNDERIYWLAWSTIQGVGPILLKRIHQHFDHLENAWKASPKALGEVNGLGGKLIQTILEQRGKIDPVQLLKTIVKKILTFGLPAIAIIPVYYGKFPVLPPFCIITVRLINRKIQA